MTRTTGERQRDDGRQHGSRAPSAPTAGRRADLLRLAVSVGNRGMAQIARQPPWYGPPMLAGEEDEDLEGLTAPPGLDLSFLDEQEAAFIDVAAPQPQHATVTPGPVAQQVAVADVPAPQQATVVPAPVAPVAPVAPAPVAPAPVAPAPVAPAPVAPAPDRLAELTGLDDERQIKRLTRKVDELLGDNVVTASAGAPYRLGGRMVTIEVVITVKAKTTSAQLVQFVVHYHPTAEKAAVGRAAASQMHVKKWGNADKFNRDEDVKHSTHPHLSKVIPKFRDAIRGWDKLPVRRAFGS